MKNNEINPELKKKLESLQNVPSRGLQNSHAGREGFLAQAKTHKPYQPPPQQQAKRGRSTRRRSWLHRLAAVFAVLLVALSSLGGTIYAAQASGPEDLLYGVKTLTEEVQVALETDPEDKLDLYVFFANRRLQEIQAQIDAGEEVSEKALNLLEKHTQKMLEQTAEMGEKGLGNALRQIETNLQKQNQMMTQMGKEHPQGGPPGLLKAQEKIQERLQLIENGINEPKGFQEKIRNEKSDNPGQGNKPENDNSNKPDTPPGQENKDNSGNGQGKGKGNNNSEINPTATGPGTD